MPECLANAYRQNLLFYTETCEEQRLNAKVSLQEYIKTHIYNHLTALCLGLTI